MPENIKITIDRTEIDYGNALFYKNVSIDVLKSALLENRDRTNKVVTYHEFSNHELKGDSSAHLKMNNGHLNGIMQDSVFENVDISHMYLDLTNDITNCTFTNVDFSQTTCYIDGTEILDLNAYLNAPARNNTITNVTFGDVAAGVGSGNTVVESTGDPYVNPLHGNIYKLPNYTANYRAFEYDDVFINVLVDHLDITNEFNHYIKRNNLESRIELGTTPITSGYWNSKLYIESEGNVATLNIENKHITYNKQYFNMKIIDNEENSMFVEDGHHKAIAIEWTHSNYGWQRFVVSYYENPQHRNGLKFESTLIHKKSTTGILIRNYKPKFMTLNKLETGYSKKLIAKSKAPNNMIVNKVISSKEKWISNKGTNTSKQINKKYSKK
jgi:hypothetical protein